MIQFRTLRPDDLELVLSWRMKPEITRFMNSDIENSIERQRLWYEKAVLGDPNAHYWIIQNDGRSIGVINLVNLDVRNKKTEWGYYIGELDAQFLGGLIPPYLFNYVFSREDWGITRILSSVMTENTSVVKTHLFHGFQNTGVSKNQVLKNGRYYDIAQLELTSAAWSAQKKRFGHYIADFELR